MESPDVDVIAPFSHKPQRWCEEGQLPSELRHRGFYVFEVGEDLTVADL